MQILASSPSHGTVSWKVNLSCYEFQYFLPLGSFLRTWKEDWKPESWFFPERWIFPSSAQIELHRLIVEVGSYYPVPFHCYAGRTRNLGHTSHKAILCLLQWYVYPRNRFDQSVRQHIRPAGRWSNVTNRSVTQ